VALDDKLPALLGLLRNYRPVLTVRDDDDRDFEINLYEALVRELDRLLVLEVAVQRSGSASPTDMKLALQHASRIKWILDAIESCVRDHRSLSSDHLDTIRILSRSLERELDSHVEVIFQARERFDQLSMATRVKEDLMRQELRDKMRPDPRRYLRYRKRQRQLWDQLSGRDRRSGPAGKQSGPEDRRSGPAGRRKRDSYVSERSLWS